MKYTITLDKKPKPPKPRDITPPNLDALVVAFTKLEEAIKGVSKAYLECDDNAKMYLQMALEA